MIYSLQSQETKLGNFLLIENSKPKFKLWTEMIQIKFNLEIINKKKVIYFGVRRSRRKLLWISLLLQQEQIERDIFKWDLGQFYSHIWKTKFACWKPKTKEPNEKKKLILPIFPYLRCLQAFQNIYQFCFFTKLKLLQ